MAAPRRPTTLDDVISMLPTLTGEERAALLARPAKRQPRTITGVVRSIGAARLAAVLTAAPWSEVVATLAGLEAGGPRWQMSAHASGVRAAFAHATALIDGAIAPGAARAWLATAMTGVAPDRAAGRDGAAWATACDAVWSRWWRQRLVVAVESLATSAPVAREEGSPLEASISSVRYRVDGTDNRLTIWIEATFDAPLWSGAGAPCAPVTLAHPLPRELTHDWLDVDPQRMAERAQATGNRMLRDRWDAWAALRAEMDGLLATVAALTPDAAAAVRAALEQAARVTPGPRVDVLRAVARAAAHAAVAAACEAKGAAALRATSGLTSMRNAFPLARGMQRRITFYVGPTNSGKSYRAFTALAEGRSGCYLAPLRLLALEGQRELVERGHPTSYLTGEEREEVPGARFVSATVELCDLARPVDVSVIDEVQMLSDPARGWAWTQALCGVPARHVVLTGSPDAVPLVQAMADYLGEPLTIVPCERLAPLRALHRPTRTADVRPGTAVIVFSRRLAHQWKRELEQRYRVAVLYGNLSPDVRRREAARFRSGDAQVLVATDAIAMGLNLPIETILFAQTDKWEPETGVRPLTTSEVLQIAGRAGRFGKYPVGYVGTVAHTDARHERVVETVTGGVPTDPLPALARVRPTWRHLETLAAALGGDALGPLITAFRTHLVFDASLFQPDIPAAFEAQRVVVDAAPRLTLRDRWEWVCAPADVRRPAMSDAYHRWLGRFALGKPSDAPPVSPLLAAPSATPGSDAVLKDAEDTVHRLTLYAWLAERWPDMYPDAATAEAARRHLTEVIARGLAGRLRGDRVGDSPRATAPPRDRSGRCPLTGPGARRASHPA